MKNQYKPQNVNFIVKNRSNTPDCDGLRSNIADGWKSIYLHFSFERLSKQINDCIRNMHGMKPEYHQLFMRTKEIPIDMQNLRESIVGQAL